MFNKRPYWGILFFSIAFYVVASLLYKIEEAKATEEAISEAFEQEARNSNDQYDALFHDKELVRRIYYNTLTPEDRKRLFNVKHGIYLSVDDKVIFWNNNEFFPITGPFKTRVSKDISQIKNSFIQIKNDDTTTIKGKRLTSVLLLVLGRSYDFENKYIQSSYGFSKYVPKEILVAYTPIEGYRYFVYQDIFFYYKIPKDGISKALPTTWITFFTFSSFFTLLLWLYLVANYLYYAYSPKLSLFFYLIAFLAFRLILYAKLPFNLSDLQVFSPQLYATNSYLPSLGDLLLNAVFLILLFFFLIERFPLHNLYDYIESRRKKYVLAYLVHVLYLCCVYYIVWIIYTLVFNSNLSFDFSQSGIWNTNKVFSMLSVVSAACLLVLFNQYLYKSLNSIVNNKWLKMIWALPIHILFIGYLTDLFQLPVIVGIIWICNFLLFHLVLDLRLFIKINHLLSASMLLRVILSSITVSMLVLYFSINKEREKIVLFSETNSRLVDVDLEYRFLSIGNQLNKEKNVHDFIRRPDLESRVILENYLKQKYFNELSNIYDINIYLFDDNHHALYNSDTFSYAFFEECEDSYFSTNSEYLFQPNNENVYSEYLATIPLPTQDSAQPVAGRFYAIFKLKNRDFVSLYPELLKPSRSEKSYAYPNAIYRYGELILKSGYYDFPLKLKNIKPLEVGQYYFDNSNDKSVLYYAQDKNVIQMVVYQYNYVLSLMTLFSYLFIMQFVLVALIIFVQSLFFSYTFPLQHFGKMDLNLRKRIHLSLLLVVLISFSIIGLVTLYFLPLQYKQTHKDTLQQIVSNVQIFLNSNLNLEDSSSLYTIALQKCINELAQQQKVDINVYDVNGLLLTTSQMDIYNKELLVGVMNPTAYQSIKDNPKTVFLQNEKIGKLQYLSAYSPILTSRNKIIGYVNIPFFESSKDLDLLVSNTFIALVNLFTLIFILSSILSTLISRYILRSFNIIISYFRNTQLRRNNLIIWPYKDEIRLLVNAYNEMVIELEKNMELLAQREREIAWREMAKQVAHEIKNPLTPMKLNIQYLQQALRNNAPNVKELTEKVSSSIIEQIDNLSIIASEFSSFAKMPEANPEALEINNFTNKILELYRNKDTIDLQFIAIGKDTYVWADYSQLLRVCTNLLENAIQAMEHLKRGKLIVKIIEDGKKATLYITDSGHGIPAAQQSKIFTPYFTTKNSGTGLGLAMCKRMVESWGGTIQFISEPNIGTTFYITLPIVEPDL